MSPPDYSDRPDPASYWHAKPPPIPRVRTRESFDEAIPIVPTAREMPLSEPPNKQVMLNSNCPPWNCPPFWAVPFDVSACACIPLALKEETIYSYKVEKDYMLVIRGISYEIHGIDQYNSFAFSFLDNGSQRFYIEDMLIDPTSANPAHRYVFAGHTRQMPTRLLIDHNHMLTVRGSFLGILDFAGNSSLMEGDILETNPRLCINIQGWLANVRDSRDGAPRPTDLGNLAHIPLEQDYYEGGYP